MYVCYDELNYFDWKNKELVDFLKRRAKMAVFAGTPITEDMMRQEMKDAGGKKELTEKLSARMKEIERNYGGSRSDIPIDPNHEYRVLEEKLRVVFRTEQ